MKLVKLPSAVEVLALRRTLVDSDVLRSFGQARERYEARLRSGWDCYANAIAAAYKGDTDRLVDCLHARKPLADGDLDGLVNYIGKKRRRRCWPPRLVLALSRPPTADDYDLLAHLVAEVGRKRGGILDAPAHRAARLARVLLRVRADRRTTAHRRDRIRMRDRGRRERR